MQTVLKYPFSRLSFSRQFMLAIAVVLVLGMATIGTWMGRQIESSAVNRASAIAAIYVESILAAQLRDWSGVGGVDDNTHAVLDRIFIDGPLRRKVLRFKLWDGNGHIVYSSDHAQLGLRFPVEGPLAAAFAGSVQARVSNLDEADNLPEHEHWPQLLEVYVPVRIGAQGEKVAVAEFYHSMENLGRDIHTAQQHSWLLVSVATIAIYLLLLNLVRRANDTILDQQRDLREQLRQLRALLDENDIMRKRLCEAGACTTALNEEFLHRVAADLHDGPAQAIAFALMRFDEVAQAYTAHGLPQGGTAQDLKAVHGALQSSLRDVRNIASGLAIPGIAELSLADTARRAVRDFERLSGLTIRMEVDETLQEAALAIKITVYRLLQESLTNSWRHAPGGEPRVLVRLASGQIEVEISDHGIGFDPQAAARLGRLGLAFMRERVRLLGGIFEIDSTQGRGTHICARIPLLSTEEGIHA
jgi:signal transduction histidine kinase